MSPLYRLMLLFLALVSTISCAHGTYERSEKLDVRNSPHLEKRAECVIPANGDGSDDAPAILDAFHQCRSKGRIIFSNTTYHINSVMKTTALNDTEVQIHGTLLWSDDTDYWLDNSMPIGYQNQSTVWFLGGTDYQINGYGAGTLDGNGQVWYDLVKGQSNYPNRPMALTIVNTTNAQFSGLNFVQSQMWTMTIMHSNDVLLEDIYVNSTSHNGNPARNTDGADTMFSDNITFRRWTVDNGDDCISSKANSTNILVEDSTFIRGLGFAVGSIGQYDGVYETIENITVRNIQGIRTRYAGYIKTWTGDQVDYPPNGGGGGLGYARNITFENFALEGGTTYPIQIGQCTTFSGTTGDCDSSLFKIEDISWVNITGDVASDFVCRLQCSEASGGCENIRIAEIDLVNSGDGDPPEPNIYRCDNVENTIDFQCS